MIQQPTVRYIPELQSLTYESSKNRSTSLYALPLFLVIENFLREEECRIKNLVLLTNDDSYKLRLGISRCDRLRDKKIEALTKLGLSSPSSFLLKPRPNLMSQSLLRFSRVFCMTEAELDDFLANASLQNATECHLTLNSEVDKRVIEFLSYRLKLILHGYVSDLNVSIRSILPRDSKHWWREMLRPSLELME
ncbi:hypothetical protein QAD02_003360 [Eretmocerus hayati]|uniref:Uncharacterized protein n=1 Tax=Eretmocerus hayati TaxID=131215 RepID=A0ACC2NNB6_9HYME|nr:hypothetical protein QAD02_003360 [Eretmocerus hayati]